MTYDPHRTNILPTVEQPFPITDEMPAVVPPGRGPGRSSRVLLGILAAVLIAGIVGIAAILVIDNQRSDETAETPAAPTVPVLDEAPTPSTPELLEDDEPGYWQVVDVPDGLNVRSGPGVENDVIGALRLGDRHIFATGERATVGGGQWRQIVFGDDDTSGWVSARFLAPDTAPGEAVTEPTPAATGSTSVVCFAGSEAPRMVARLTFTNRTEISGVLRTIGEQGPADQRVTGTLVDGQAEVSLTPQGSNQATTQTWTFNPATVDIGNGRSLRVVDCGAIADQLP